VREIIQVQEAHEPAVVSLPSEIIGDDGKLSIDRMLQTRRKLQSGTTTKSERTVRLNPKFALRRVTDVTNPINTDGKVKMTLQEAAQRTRIAQALANDTEKETKAREIRWQNVAKGLRNIISAQGKSIFWPFILELTPGHSVVPNVAT
jgi:hypothetical protein